MVIAFIFSLLFSAVVVVFALHNSDIITVNFILVEHNISQALVILLSAASGAISVLLLGMVSHIQLKIKIRKLTKTITHIETQERLLKEKADIEHMERLEKENRLFKEKEEKRETFEANGTSEDEEIVIEPDDNGADNDENIDGSLGS